MNRRFALPVALVTGMLIVGLGLGCDSMRKKDDKDAAKTTMKGGRSLYDRLGGEVNIRAVVDEFVTRAAADPAVNFTRKGRPNEWELTNENVMKLKRGLIAFIGEHTGGPQRYQGRDMTAVHTGMQITDAEFSASAGHLVDALNKLKVPKAEQDELLAIVGGTRGAIVGK